MLHNKIKGFTLVEIILVVSIFIILTAVLVPIGLGFYANQQLESNTQELIFNLRRAQEKSMSVEEDSSFGIYFEDDKYILFKGNSYSERDFSYDEVFVLPRIINREGDSEIVFSKFNGEVKKMTSELQGCIGTCSSCWDFNNEDECRNQKGCFWFQFFIFRICFGRCTSCNQFTDQTSCENQSGCSWFSSFQDKNIILTTNNRKNIININEIGRINLQ